MSVKSVEHLNKDYQVVLSIFQSTLARTMPGIIEINSGGVILGEKRLKKLEMNFGICN